MAAVAMMWAARLRALGVPKQARWAAERGIWAVVVVRGQEGKPELAGAEGGVATGARWAQQLALEPAAAALATVSPKHYLHRK